MALFDHASLARDIAARAASLFEDQSVAALATAALRSGSVELTAHGAISAQTGIHTGRSPKDKFVVRDSLTQNHVWWDNCGAMSPTHFDVLLDDALAHLAGQDVQCQHLLAGADRGQQYGVAVYTPSAWHALFIRNLLIRPGDEGQAPRETDVTIVHVPGFKADPERHGTRTETVIALDMSRNVVVIGGTFYAGEIKKSVFSLFNFHAPLEGVLPMHCSANIGAKGDTALFFGLSGTGKTTLSTDPERVLIGDDEHGWGENGVFNLEGGCYAKTIKLSASAEPEIFAATKMFGTVLENVVLDDVSKVPDFDDGSRTENTRAAYPLSAMPHVSATGTGPTPKTVVFLTADAFGVLPPIAKLSTEQAVYHFLSGYTAKVAGTERGVTEPQATFSACFGAPFMSHHPLVYGRMLADKLEASGASTWLVNTGWMGGAYGTGQRISIAATRRLLKAALSGELDGADMRVDPVFGFAVPKAVAGVDAGLLDPRASWTDKQAYDAQAEKLVGLFVANFARFSEAADMVGAGPRLAQAAE